MNIKRNIIVALVNCKKDGVSIVELVHKDILQPKIYADYLQESQEQEFEYSNQFIRKNMHY